MKIECMGTGNFTSSFTFLDQNEHKSNTAQYGLDDNCIKFESQEKVNKFAPGVDHRFNGKKFDWDSYKQRQNHNVQVTQNQMDFERLQTKKINTQSFNEDDYYKRLNEQIPAISNDNPQQLPPELQPQKFDHTQNSKRIDQEYERLVQSRNYQGQGNNRQMMMA